MVKKRLIGVVTVKNDLAVQSFGFKHYLPLGNPECLIENLDRWGADEILVQVIDRSIKNLGPDFELMKRIGELGIGTPLIYAGGIHTVTDAVRIVQLGADRIMVDSMLFDNSSSICELSKNIGAQAVIASLPINSDMDKLYWYDYRFKKTRRIPSTIYDLIDLGYVSEVLITDWLHEGKPNSFDQKIINEFCIKDIPIIVFGGISEPEQMKKLLKCNCVKAVAIGNFLSYREHAIQSFKATLTDVPLRVASFESKFPLIFHA